MDNIVLDEKRYIHKLLEHIYNYINTDSFDIRMYNNKIIVNMYSILDLKSNISDILENVINNMHEYNQTILKKQRDNNYYYDVDFNNDIYSIENIENDYRRLKEMLLTKQEQKQLEELKKIDTRIKYTNEDINKIHKKYIKIIICISYKKEVVEIDLIDGEKLKLKCNDRLLII